MSTVGFLEALNGKLYHDDDFVIHTNRKMIEAVAQQVERIEHLEYIIVVDEAVTIGHHTIEDGDIQKYQIQLIEYNRLSFGPNTGIHVLETEAI